MVQCGKCCKCADKGTNGISQIKRTGRGCTDPLALLAFLLSWGVIAFILKDVNDAGANPDRVIYPVDMWGQICGVDEKVKDKPFGAMPYPWSTEGYKSLICVEDCSYTQSTKNINMSALYPSTDLLGYCLPSPFTNLTINVEISGNFNPQLMDASKAISNGVADVLTARYVMGASFGTALITTFMFCIFLKTCAKTLIYSLLFMIIGMGLMLGQFLLEFAKEAELDGVYSPQTIEYLEIAGYIVMGLAALFTVVLFFFRNQIDIAVEVTREAAKALLDMKAIILFPLMPCLVALAYFFFFVYVGTHIYSVAELTEVTTPASTLVYDQVTWSYYALEQGTAGTLGATSAQLTGGINSALPDKILETKLSGDEQNYMFFHVFHFFWVTQFLFYFGYATFAGATADWYFTATDANGKKKRGDDEDALTNWPVLQSVKRVLRYHTGTLAVCAFIIAVVKMARLVITYVEAKTKGEPPNRLQKAIFVALQCYLKCLECCLDKINKYALVWMAIYGDGFAHSVCSSFALVWRNLFRVAAVNTVSSIIFIMCKVSVALMNAGIVCGVLTFHPYYKDTLSSPLGPTMMVLFSTYVVASLFFIVFSSTIDTMFLCFLVDSEVNEKGSMMASIGLQKLVGKYSKQSKEDATRQKEARNAREGADVKDFHELDQDDVELTKKNLREEH